MKSKAIAFYLTLFSSISFSQALVISEIMYDPQGSDTDREWVEVLNDTSATVDLSSYKFFENNTNHGLTSVQGSMILSPGAYAVIVDNPTKFLSDNSSFQGTLIDSTFSLSNTGEYLALKDGSGAIKDSVTYVPALGGQDDGSTLSMISGAWVRGAPTPGVQNQVSVASTQTTISSSQNTAPDTSSDYSVPAQQTSPGADVSVVLPERKVVIAGADAEFSTKAVSSRKTIENADFTWSFGDGGTKTGKSVGYHYEYPGDYIVIVETKSDAGVATGKMKVKVVPADILITKAATENNKSYVELSNNGAYDVDLSDWCIEINGMYYVIPKNTIMLPKTSVRFVGSAMGFNAVTITASTSIRLLYPNKSELVRYLGELPAPMAPALLSKATSTFAMLKKTVANKYGERPVTQEVIGEASSTIVTSSHKDTGLLSWFRSFFKH
jgi:hypothetical protein